MDAKIYLAKKNKYKNKTVLAEMKVSVFWKFPDQEIKVFFTFLKGFFFKDF